ncbi:transcription factor-like [Raphidocelis subcapitata]|uniref:Transcription factor-like n=1 Tax=Raphidocelis subcapitata TaxID=307507 RepID=A0A2V0NPX0_9CHLO|nr:transcription factor-like [Raphidocelis subcapitata]|eukprot:GBF89688.1 transcription factor-like [Raphidocelis subcapitata]
MEAAPGAADAGDLHAAYYGFLAETEDLGAAVAALAQEDLDAAALAGASTSTGKGRKRVKQLADVESEELSDEEDDKGGKGKRPGGRAPEAARTKANRERMRREKINEKFIELAQLVEPNKDPKTDRLTVLCEAIRTVQQFQVENHQLKQLNKFLEEKAAALERERAQSMFFQMQGSMMAGGMVMQPQPGMLMAGGGMGGGMGAMGGGMMAGAPGMMAAQQQQQQQQPAHLQAMARVQSCGALQQQQPLDPQQQHQQQQLDQQQPIQHQQLDQQQPNHHHQQQQQQQSMGGFAASEIKAGAPAGAMMAPQAGGMAFFGSMVPPTMLDANQDSLLRPPAA